MRCNRTKRTRHYKIVNNSSAGTQTGSATLLSCNEIAMSLVKTSKIPGAAAKSKRLTTVPVASPQARSPSLRANKAANGSQSDKISERVAAATEELASGLTEASAAAEELRRSMEQIAAGAEEASGASQEQLEAVKSVAANLRIARSEADNARRRTEATQVSLTETATQSQLRYKQSNETPNDK